MGVPKVNTAQLCLVAALASVLPCHAASSQKSDTLDEIVVTAQKREENLQRIALSLSVMQGDVLRTMGVQNTTQLEEIIPNMTVRSDRPGQSFPSIRGIGTPIEGLGVDQGVAVYIDGVQVDSPIVNILSVLEVERVEVLRGPQGTLYGRNAIGGVINIVSKTPSQEFSGRVRAGIGNYSAWEGGLSVEGALVPGLVAGRIGAAYHENRDGWYRNNAADFIGENVADNGATKNGTVRAMLDYQPAENLQISVSGDYSRTDTSGPPWKPLDDVNALAKASALQGIIVPVYSEGDPDVFALAHNLDSFNDSRVYGAGLTIDYRLSNRIELVSITGYRENELEILEDIDASPYQYLEVASDATARSVSQELRFHYSDERVDGVVGLIYTDAVYRDQFSVDVVAEFIAAAGGSEPAITRRRSEAQSFAVFSQWDWNVTDRLTLIFGGRWSESEKESRRTEYVFTELALSAVSAGVERCFILLPGVGPNDQPACLTNLSIPGQGEIPLPPEITEGTGDGSWSRFTPKLGARLQVNEETMLYASYSQGYRDGGLAGDAANFRQFDEEVVDAYEAGIKSGWFNGQLSINGAIFFYDYEDLQFELSQLRDNLVSTSVFNAAGAELLGAEIESTWSASDLFRLSVDVGWLETEITKLDQSDPDLDFGFVRPGNVFPQAPEWTASLVPELHFPLANGSVTWRSEINYKDSYFQDAENGGFADETDALILTGANIADGVPPEEATVAPGTLIDSERLDSRVIVNTSLAFVSADDRLEVSVWGRNLFDEKYTVNRNFVPGLVYTNSLYGAPRTYGANVSYRF